MKSLSRFSLIALLALTLPGVASAQRADGAARAARGPIALLPQAPGEMVLEHRTQLGLTAEQLAQIEQIRVRAAAESAPILARLRAAGYPTTSAERDALTVGKLRALRERSAELAPALRELRASQQAATREIQNLLTLEQYSRLRDLTRTGVRPALVDRRVRPLPGARGRLPGAGRGVRARGL